MKETEHSDTTLRGRENMFIKCNETVCILYAEPLVITMFFFNLYKYIFSYPYVNAMNYEAENIKKQMFVLCRSSPLTFAPHLIISMCSIAVTTTAERVDGKYEEKTETKQNWRNENASWSKSEQQLQVCLICYA